MTHRYFGSWSTREELSHTGVQVFIFTLGKVNWTTSKPHAARPWLEWCSHLWCAADTLSSLWLAPVNKQGASVGFFFFLRNGRYARHAYPNAQGLCLFAAPDKAAEQRQLPRVYLLLSSRALSAFFISSVMQQPWPACRLAKGGFYAWSQSTPNSIILERASCVSSSERLFTCAEPRCYFASPSVFIMMALFCLFFFFLVGGLQTHRASSSVL